VAFVKILRRVMGGTAEKREDAEVSNTDLETLIEAAHAALEAYAAKIDALNVYPVPDGDTGTNMLLTVRAVLEKVSTLSDLRREAAVQVVSRAALMGARGNSGVILSQMLRGAGEALSEARVLDAEALAVALTGAKERAYAAVQNPVEGSMLSVIKDAAVAAQSCVKRGEKDRLEVLKAAAREAHASVKRTPELLGILKEAGVVDAGGLGVAVILDGLIAALSGEEPVPDLDEANSAVDGERLKETVTHSAQEAWGYCTEFIVNGFTGSAKEFEARIHHIGKSVLVILNDDLVKVHLHTQDPGGALTYAGNFGRLSGVKVDDLEAQTRARVESEAPPISFSETAAKLGVVVASQGIGNRQLFESMGAVVVEGGQGANPSTQDFVRAIRSSGAAAVILLPNNKNVVSTAERVGELTEIEVYVVPTTNIVGGLAVMVGYDAEGEPEKVAEEMREIEEGLLYAEVTVAVRDTKVEGREVRKGAYIGLLDGKLYVSEASIHGAALALIEATVEEGADVVTLLRGADLAEAAVEEIAEAIRGLGSHLMVEIKNGGQPLYPLQMVAE
jgi:DAK2 domain fusion protein YloV